MASTDTVSRRNIESECMLVKFDAKSIRWYLKLDIAMIRLDLESSYSEASAMVTKSIN